MDRQRRLRRFRLRLLAAFGLGMAPGLFYTSGEVEADETQVYCYDLDGVAEAGETGEAACEGVDTDSFALGHLGLDNSDFCEVYSLVGLAESADPNACCYEVSVDDSMCAGDYDDGVDCGCYGRPYVDGVEVVAAPVVRNSSWGPSAAPDVVPELAGLTLAQRAALAEFWSDNARAEHSSVAGFHRVCLELIAHNAPLELLARSQQAAADELAHARICFALASHYADEPLGPGPMALGRAAPIAASLVELAISTAREGCLGETSAAWLADEMAANATDPAVRAALERIASEELDHAALAWMTLRWAIEVGGSEVREAVARVFAEARPSAVDRGGSGISVPSHGLLAANDIQWIVDRGFNELLAPMLHTALAARVTRAAAV